MKNIDLEVNIENLTEKSLYGLCLASATKDIVSLYIAGVSGKSVEQVQKEIENTADQYFVRLQNQFAAKSFNIRLTADQVKWLISDDPSVPKPPDVI